MTPRPRRSVRRLLLLGAVVLAVGVPAAASAAPAAPSAPRGWHDGVCAADDNVGVTVVIDFQDLGGGVNVRCTGGAPSDGADALDQAGISWQGVLRWGRGFVCKIAGKPAADPCIDTPPTSAYWGYWVAPRGGSWCFSNLGVLNRRPPPGSVEGWSFSLDHEGGTSPAPRFTPPALAAGLKANPLNAGDCDPGGGTVPTTAPATTTTRPAGGSNSGSPGMAGAPGAGSPATTTPRRAPSSTTTTTAAGTTTTTTDGGPGDAAAPSRGGDRSSGGDEDAAGREVAQNPVDLSADGTEQDGFPLATLLGVVAVAGLGATAWLATRRRLRTADGDPPEPV